MKFICERSTLLAAVNIAGKACAAKSSIPALEGILVEAYDGEVKLTGFDLKEGIYTKFEADVPDEGAVILSAKLFSEIARSLPDGNVTFKMEEGLNVSITCGNAFYNLIGSDAADFPQLPEIDAASAVSLPQNLLSKMIRETIYAVSDNESRPVYTGELFEISEGYLTLVSVDGYRLALRREQLEQEGEDISFIVPGLALSDLEKLCGDTDDAVLISLGSKHIGFEIGDTVLISRRLEGDFLNYRKTVPNTFAVTLRVERIFLQRTVERVALMIDDKVKNPIRCILGEDELRIVTSTAVGKAEDTCYVDGNGGGMEIGFNHRYLLDALKAAPKEELEICFNSPSAPCVIRAADGTDNFAAMILPVRIKAD